MNLVIESKSNQFKKNISFEAKNVVEDKNSTSEDVNTDKKDLDIKGLFCSDNYSKKQVCGAVLATALAATTITGLAMKHKISSLERAGRELESSNNLLQTSIRELRVALEEATGRVSEEISSIEARLKAKINREHLSYDIEQPPVTGQKIWNPNEHHLRYPKSVVRPGIRTNMTKLEIPEISQEGRFEFTVPRSNEMEISRVPVKDFNEARSVSTAISENYSDSVVWNDDKIARDILQNFYDGHGQTLDGVTLKFEPVSNGKYRVRIEGLSTYSADKAAYIGESSKRDNANAAGNYGEGLKMAALKLLKDKGASKFRIGSGNWNLSYKLENGNLSDARVLSYDLEKVPNLEGNFVEFETTDKNLLESLRKTIDRFYHSRNMHFKDPEFENSTFGIKLVGKGEKGGLYIAGQRFEFNGDYDGLDNVLYLKTKPPIEVLDASRDRTSINISQLAEIAKWLGKSCTTQQEKLQLLKILEPYAEFANGRNLISPTETFLKKFIDGAYYGSADLNGKINFPENYIAYSQATPDIVRELLSNGYKVFIQDFNTIGMRDIHDFYGNVRKHTPIQPTKVQEQKIKLLKEALKVLNLPEKYFSPEELDTKIYLFNSRSPLENRVYGNTSAEAIIEKGVSKGFWIDTEYLDKNSFSEVLETTLHELCHKAGGDGSSNFSYKLTDVNAEALNKIINDENVLNALTAMKNLWNKLSL